MTDYETEWEREEDEWRESSPALPGPTPAQENRLDQIQDHLTGNG